MSYLNALKTENNYTFTENGAITHKSTEDALLDLFAMGGVYRNRSDEDCIFLFKRAYEYNPTYALKCLFYLRDVLEGQGERRFFRVCMKWLANEGSFAAERNLGYIAEFGRWDDLYLFVGTPLEKKAMLFMRKQFELDLGCKTPSLLGKWLKSVNTSSEESKKLGRLTCRYFGMTERQYRQALSMVRARINVLERLMSAREWDKIEFDKIPSRAGLIYKNAFARHDVERMKQGAEKSYADFAKDKNTKVNAKALYPYEVVEKAIGYIDRHWRYSYSYRSGHLDASLDDTDRLMINKYWDNLTDYFKGASLDALAVVDTSGSMCGTPINVAISLGLYCAEKAQGPFHGHYVSFSSRPQLIETNGVDFVDKVNRIYQTNLCENTDIEATFNMLLDTAIHNHMRQEELPKSIVVISDMEFDAARGSRWVYGRGYVSNDKQTLMEGIKRKWELAGYKMPSLVFWCVDSRHDNVPMKIEDGISMISGFSATLFEQIMKGKTAIDLMYDKLNSERYAPIH